MTPEFPAGCVAVPITEIRRCHRKRRKFGGREMKTPLIQAEEGREAPMEFGA